MRMGVLAYTVSPPWDGVGTRRAWGWADMPATCWSCSYAVLALLGLFADPVLAVL